MLFYYLKEIFQESIKRKRENTLLYYLKEIFQESIIFLYRSQPKSLPKLHSNASITQNLILP